MDPACITLIFKHDNMGASIALPLTAVQSICLLFALLEVFAESEGILEPYLSEALKEIGAMQLKKG